ncbi:MAG: hypothetical protein ACOCZD_01650 [Haloferacaceae archaeon]
MFRKVRRLGYAWLAINGLAHTLAPRLMLKFMSRLWLLGFENVDKLEVRDWYATTTRAAGVGMIAAGITGLLLDREPDTEPEPNEELDDGTVAKTTD